MPISRRRALRGAAAILLSAPIFAAAPALAGPVELTTARGPVAVESAPQKLAVFDIPAIDTLVALGRVPDAVPAPLLVGRLAEATAGAAKVGTVFEPDYEALAAFGPDLIIVGGRAAPRAEALAQFAPTLDMTISEDAVGDGLARLDDYAALLGAEDKAAEIRARLEEKLARASALAQASGDALIVMTNGPKMSAYGENSRFGWLHARLGWAQAAEVQATGRHGESISFEYIAHADPDVLIVIDRAAAIGQAGAGALATLDTALVHGTKAWKAGRVLVLDPAELYLAGGGVGAIERTLDQVIEGLTAAGVEG